MTPIRNLATWLFFAALSPAAVLAQDDRPKPPDEVFRYVVFDAGDALEIDWSVDDGAYMYRSAFGFASGDTAVVLGDAELPEGKIYTDEFLGEQEIYRGNFFVRIPYEVRGAKPAELEFTIKSRGCLDSGFCYVPTTWTETVELRQAALASASPAPATLNSLGGSDFPPPDEVFFPNLFEIDGTTAELGFRIVPGFYLYRDKISVRSLNDDVYAERLMLPEGKSKTDEFFGEQEVYYDEAFGRVYLKRATPEPMTLELEVGYQGCADGGLCYLPQSKILTVELAATSTTVARSEFPSDAAPVADPAAVDGQAADAGSGTASSAGNVAPRRADNGKPPVSEQGRLAQIITGSSIWVTAGVFFLAGLGLAFTPCVLPMIPILSGIIAGEGDDVSTMRGFTLALSYVMGMALVYTAAGVAAAAAGVQLQAAFNQPWVLILIAGLFVLLALAMFGAYDLQMPSGIQSRIAGISGSQKSGTMVGAFVMGALSALVVTACVAPALIAALTVMAQSKEMVRGGLALFAMSMGMGAPLLLVGAAQGKFLPKAGPWMVAVKGAFGFMMLGLAIWMLGRILPGTLTMSLWAALIFISGVFMGGLTTLTTDSSIARKLGKGFGLLAILYGLVLFLGAMSGGTNPLKPLASISLGGSGFGVEKEKHLEFVRIKTVDDLDREIAAASAAGKTVMLDFYADWCVSCIEMEEYTFITKEVQAALANTVPVQADVTKNDAEDQQLLQRFGVFGPPTIIFFDTAGRQLEGYEVVGFMNAEKFAAHVNTAFGS